MTKLELDKLNIFLTNFKHPGNYSDAKQIILHFYEWMNKKQITVENLTYTLLWEFYQKDKSENKSAYRRYNIRNITERYLNWLHSQKLVSLPIEQLCPRRPKQRSWPVHLSMNALEFLELSRVQRKQSTHQHHKLNIRVFHYFIKSNKIRLKNINRTNIETFFRFLYDEGLSSSSRTYIITVVRMYLSWLYERGRINQDPGKLFKRGDLPKIPNRLPRPFSLEVDSELQSRLSTSNHTYSLGLLLMRKTGIRVGELCDLPYNCVHSDSKGHQFLKVPLGKLDSERMVPLDESAMQIIDKLQRNALQQNKLVKDKDRPDRLVLRPSGRPTKTNDFFLYFTELTYDLKLPSPAKTHQLRHTYATTLLNAGMSLLALRAVLGHQNIRMTMKYAAVTQENVREQYFAALGKMKDRYEILNTNQQTATSKNIQRTLSDLVLMIKQSEKKSNPESKVKIKSIINRINHIKHELR